MDLKGRTVLVVGLGVSGRAAVGLLKKKGARVVTVDEKNGPRKFPSNVDLIVTSPGVPWDHPELKKARARGVPVWGELELGWRFVRPKNTIAVTGTNGKTTTTALIGWLLKKSRRPVVVGGNIGAPLSGLTQRINAKTFLVLEVSSYQLESQDSFHPNVGMILNVTPDHLKRHKTMARYAAAKARVFKNMTRHDVAVLNGKDAWCRRVSKSVRAKKVFFPSTKLMNLARSIKLPGRHNLENAMAASAAALAVGLTEKEIKAGLSSFKGVKHRIQPVRTWRGVHFINDSKATNVDSTLVALEACRRPLYLILGGEHKGTPYTPLKTLIKKKVKEILTIGEAASIVAKDLKGAAPIVSCKTMRGAVAYAAANAKPHDTVLLSPACASFDQYKNYEQRGDDFIGLVSRLRP
jgi:UDP-N-acetylmuramoylalanine--D-glutamate ligase